MFAQSSGVASSMISTISLSSQLEFLHLVPFQCYLFFHPWCYKDVVVFFSLGAYAILYLFRITKLSFFVLAVSLLSPS